MEWLTLDYEKNVNRGLKAKCWFSVSSSLLLNRIRSAVGPKLSDTTSIISK